MYCTVLLLAIYLPRLERGTLALLIHVVASLYAAPATLQFLARTLIYLLAGPRYSSSPDEDISGCKLRMLRFFNRSYASQIKQTSYQAWLEQLHILRRSKTVSQLNHLGSPRLIRS